MGQMTRRQALATAGVAAITALGVRPAKARQAANTPAIYIDHPQKTAAPHFVAFGTVIGGKPRVNHLRATVYQGIKEVCSSRCHVVPIPNDIDERFFWYVACKTDKPTGDYSLEVRDTDGVAATQTQSFTVGVGGEIGFTYPTDGSTNVPLNLAAYGTDTDGDTEASYLLWVTGFTGRGGTMDVVQEDWSAQFLNLHPSTTYNMRVYDTTNPTGKKISFTTAAS
jgi:hypothetical protein